MKLLKSKLSMAIAIGILGGSTQAFACVVTPDSILTEGQTLQLVADCTADPTFNTVETINWQMAVGTSAPVSITGDVKLAQPKPKLIYLTTPIGLTSAGTGEYTFSVTGTYVGGNAITTTLGESAKVIVKPASVAVALALGTATVTPVNASCGTSDSKTVASMPTGMAQCSTGSKSALAISGPSYFTWSCMSQTGGVEANCYATRTGYVAPTTTTTTAPTTTAPTTTAPTTTAPTTTAPTNTASTSSSDPGTGLWVPPNTTNRIVAGQSGTTVQHLTSYVPGCLNGLYITTASASGCGGTPYYKGVIAGTDYSFAFGSGKVLSLRYKSKSTAGTSVKYFTMASGDGGNVGQNVKVWLSTNPAATYDATSTSCKSTSTTQPYVVTGPGYCPITPNTTYYLSMSIDQACTTCRYKVEEAASDFQ